MSLFKQFIKDPKQCCTDHGSHEAEAMALSCIDWRLIDATIEDLEKGAANPFDYTALPGASLFVVNPSDHPEFKKTYYDIAAIAIDLHNIKGFVVVEHYDCGAYKIAYPEYVDPITHKIPKKIEKKLHKKNVLKLKKRLAELYPNHWFEGYIIALDHKITRLV